VTANTSCANVALLSPRNIFRFSNDKNVLVGTDAMAEGLNIPEGNYIIHYDLPFHASTMIQRNGRARRVNSNKKHIFVHYMISRESIDEKRLLERRLIYGSYPDIVKDMDNSKKNIKSLAGSYLYKDIFALENNIALRRVSIWETVSGVLIKDILDKEMKEYYEDLKNFILNKFQI
jgi:superfamily II DNA/RNA helicase